MEGSARVVCDTDMSAGFMCRCVVVQANVLDIVFAQDMREVEEHIVPVREDQATMIERQAREVLHEEAEL